jgi:hypothetical protein
MGNDPEIAQWTQMSNGLRAELARIAGEVGNLAQTEQNRALELVPDLFGGITDKFPFVKLPDSREVANKKLELMGQFLKTGLEAANGPNERSGVQNKLRGILNQIPTEQPAEKLNEVSMGAQQNEIAKTPNDNPGNLTKEEFEFAKQQRALGKTREEVAQMIVKRRRQNKSK